MKRLLCALWLGAGLVQAQTSPLTFYIHDTSGAAPDTPLNSSYAFANTPTGSSTPLVIRAVNSSTNTIYWANAFVSDSADSFTPNSNFSVVGQAIDIPVAPQGSMIFTVNFTPVVTGNVTAFLRVRYQIQQPGCIFTDGSKPCPSGTANASTLTGSGTNPQLVLSYQPPNGNPVVLQPSSGTPFDFGSVSTSSSVTATFILSNRTSGPLAKPTIKLQGPEFFPSAFRLDTSSLPTLISGNSSVTFTITFAPGQAAQGLQGTLVVGTLSYLLQGTGIDLLTITYTDMTPCSPSFGVRISPQVATPIQFDQIVPGGCPSSSILNFQVTHNGTSYDPVEVSPLSVSGTGFALAGAPAGSISIAPGTSINFTVSLAAVASGSYAGSLSIGTRKFTLQGLAVIPPFPSFSFQLNPQQLTSRQQPNLSIHFASPLPFDAHGTLTMKFTPLLANVTDDPFVSFLDTSKRQLTIDLAAGAQTATYKGESDIGFQTGTTAGTLTFTLELVNTAPYSQSFTIAPATIQVTSVAAVRQNPNLLVTINGYDNTYTAGQLSFTFYDLTGKLITPIAIDEAADFQHHFFTDNAGGAFSLTATFPVRGDVTQVGSVAIGLTNSKGQTNTTQTFQ